MMIDQATKGALEAARAEKIHFEPFPQRPVYSQFYEGGACPIPLEPLPPLIFLGPMRLASFAHQVDALIDENKALRKKVEALQQALYQLGRAAADAAKVPQ